MASKTLYPPILESYYPAFTGKDALRITFSLSKYNIMLLDEIDGPLDSRNREKFIRILENQIERIDSEQNFLITHNAMFSSYPVDIIDLSGNLLSEKK